MGGCITIIILLILIIIYFIDKYSLHKALKERVSWCASNDRLQRDNLTLLEHINNIEADLKYKIVTELEESMAKDILQSFKNDLIQAYFNDRLSVDRKIINPNYYLKDKAYFFILLSSFLRKHECEPYFNSKTMYILKSKETYGRWGGELYDATYELADLGIVYHKLYYLAQLFCEKCGFSSHGETERIKKCLETKEIQISRM